ncbi:TPM domain-containing protein [Alkalinema pantanalense CENA528]|uniref:TPM domain-containing protein n=1 Tax=Alkalinema pantanalense TaxID=1620705 RepID=UPI003D6E1D54
MQKFSLQSLCLSLLIGGGLLFTIVAPVLAIPIHEVPNPRKLHSGWVADTADLLTPATEAQLNQAVTALEAKNGSEIAIVTVADTQPSQSPKAFATELFNTWGIGKQTTNNGVLFLISKADRRVEVEVGSGLHTVLPDRAVTDLLAQKVAPQFRQGQFDQGTIDGVQAILDMLEQSRSESGTVGTERSDIVGGIFAFCIASGGALLWVSRRQKRASQPATSIGPSVPISQTVAISSQTLTAPPQPTPVQANPAQSTKTNRKKKAKKNKGKASKQKSKQNHENRSHAESNSSEQPNYNSSHSSIDNSNWDTNQYNSWNTSDTSNYSSHDYSSSDYSSSSSSDYSSSDFGGGSSDGGGGGCDW